MSTIRRQKSERVGSYRVFDVLRHEMIDREGQPMREAFTFACRDWVSVVPVTREGSVVLVRQYRHGIDAPSLEVPGGIIDEGQQPEEAAVRELREETGYGDGIVASLGTSLPNPALQNNTYHMFLARDVRLLGEPEFDVGEYCELVVLSENEVRREMESGGITHSLALLALSRAFEVLGSHSVDEVLALLSRMEDLQSKKVIDLARRLRPDLTAEDIKNPHDFPGLDDTDWHFEDGQLAGIQSVAAALRAMKERGPSGGRR
jgi:8-oxo-dGTP pyrophosphatase MutT (NUDIX family)